MALFKPLNETLFQMHKHEFWNPNLWEFYFDDKPSIRFLIKSTNIPLLKFETETRNSGHKVLTSFEPEDSVSVTFNETNDFDVINYMQDWMDEIYDQKERKFKTGKTYVKQGVATFFKYTRINLFIPSDGQTTYTYKFVNMMITGIEDIELSYETAENKTITCNFTVDQVIKTKAVPNLL